MTTDHNPNFSERKTDPDIDEQALPGHGVPSQDPDPNAQLGMSPSETRREKSSTFVIGGALVGLAAGAVIGAAARPDGCACGCNTRLNCWCTRRQRSRLEQCISNF